MKQWQFNIIITAVVLALAGLVLWLVPETRVAVKVFWIILVWAFKILIFLLIWAIMLIGPGVIGFFGRGEIKIIYENVVKRGEKLSPWMHILICVMGGFVLSVLWVFVIRWLVGLPTLVLASYNKPDPLAYANLMEVWPWGWCFVTFLSFGFGYVFFGYGDPDKSLDK